MYNAVSFSDDDSLWVLYPSESHKKLTLRDSEPAHSAALAHVALDGKVLGICGVNLSSWLDAQLFVDMDGNPIVQSGANFQSFDGTCTPRASVSLTGENLLRTHLSVDRRLLYVITSGRTLVAIQASTLKILFRQTFPASTRAGEISVAQNVAAYAFSKPGPGGCETQSVMRRTLSSTTDSPWAQLSCSEFVAFTDDLLLVKRRFLHNELLSLIDQKGGIVGSVTTENGSFVDTPSFYLQSFSRPEVNRIAERLFTRKVKAGASERLHVFDLPSKKSVLQISVCANRIFSFALSHNGHDLGVVCGATMDVYRVP